MLSSQSKSFFSEDALIACLLVVTILSVSVYAVYSSHRAYALEAEKSLRQAELLVLADDLIKTCFGENGLAKCRNGMVYSHVLDERAELYYGEGSFCVNRVVLFNGGEKVLTVCVRE